ncbi:hypothetical protein LFM09_39305 [Lentzea alba]
MIRKALLGAAVFGALIIGGTTASADPQDHGTQTPVTTEHAPRTGT